MSSDYYFRKWRDTITNLGTIAQLDHDYQVTKAHDQKRCHAAQRLCGVLGKYIVVYNEALICHQNNLQLQKSPFIFDVTKAIETRILELKHQVSTLEACNYQFMSQSLIPHHLTTYDVEFNDISTKINRPEHVQCIIEEALRKAKEHEDIASETSQADEKIIEKVSLRNWWDTEGSVGHEHDEEPQGQKEVEEILSKESIKYKMMLTLIQAHEKSRQVIQKVTLAKQKREKWIRELEGKSSEKQISFKIKCRSAKIMQTVFRKYFEIKRGRKHFDKLDERLGLKINRDRNMQGIIEVPEAEVQRHRNLFQKYNEEWAYKCKEIQESYIKRKCADISDDFRDQIRAWFRDWFDTIQYICDIPTIAQGGFDLIVREEFVSPTDWLEEYKAYMEEKLANKNKTALQIKYEKMEAEREKKQLKKEELLKKKMEAELMKRNMKNPNMHPGFIYPTAKKTTNILKVIEQYQRKWSELDIYEAPNVKEKFVHEVDVNDMCMKVKLKILEDIDEEMREELKQLKAALKADYKRNGEEFPTYKKPLKKIKKEKKIEIKITERVTEQMEALAMKGVLKEYNPTKLQDFTGDPNYAGDDLRCKYIWALPFAGETRAMWWEKCVEFAKGSHPILLVGPEGSGKTHLIHALATLNDATLFEIDVSSTGELASSDYFQQLTNSLVSCAKVAQPSVIHFKNVHLVYSAKIPQEVKEAYGLIKRYLIQKLCKRIHKTDKITVIGSCVDPWLTDSKQIMKQFPDVILMPNACCTTIVQLLKTWMVENRSIPSNLDISNLAYVLQTYTYGYIKKSLQNFLSAERIVRIAAFGLKPADIHDYIIENDDEFKVDIARYLKWYSEKTIWGKKEQKQLEQQREFKLMAEKFAENMKKKTSSDSNLRENV